MRGAWTTSGAALGALVLAACGGPQPENNSVTYRGPIQRVDTFDASQQAALIFDQIRYQKCGKGRVESGGTDTESLPEAKALDAWLDKNVRAHPDEYQPISVERRDVGWVRTTENLVQTEDGLTLDFTITKVSGTSPKPPWEKQERRYMHVYSIFCDWVPSHVEIVSTSGSTSANYIGARYAF